MNKKSEILPLTGLRFIAALFVFFFHIHIRWSLATNPFLKNILDQGAIGMSVFFILSGFILAYQYAGARTTQKSYLVNRFARIYPIYAFTAIATLPWIGITFVSTSNTDIATGIGQGILLIFANIFIIQAWFPQFFSFWNDGASWSISVEVFCYIILPFASTLLEQLTIRQLCAVAFICILFSALPGLSAALFPSPAVSIFYSLPIFRLPEFILGVCTCLAAKEGLGNRYGTFSQLVVLAVIFIYLGFAGPALPIYVGHNWIVAPSIAFIILSLSNSRGFISLILSSKPLLWLGKISYCIYSLQFLIIVPLIKHHDVIIEKFSLMQNNWILAMTALFFLILFSGIANYFIEEPSRIWIKRRYHQISSEK
ncbi:acyltransferase [Undibacterium sp.]|uniref:acyltransferase family protein n=1 Tax=Undibacterium sp. TaxID=1914977 RepID=UPI0025F7C207|nr:acyltransferase [Undibacterium sp.]